MRRRVTTVGNLLIHFPCLIGIATMHQTPTYEAEAKTRQSACRVTLAIRTTTTTRSDWSIAVETRQICELEGLISLQSATYCMDSASPAERMAVRAPEIGKFLDAKPEFDSFTALAQRTKAWENFMSLIPQ